MSGQGERDYEKERERDREGREEQEQLRAELERRERERSHREQLERDLAAAEYDYHTTVMSDMERDLRDQLVAGKVPRLKLVPPLAHQPEHADTAVHWPLRPYVTTAGYQQLTSMQ